VFSDWWELRWWGLSFHFVQFSTWRRWAWVIIIRIYSFSCRFWADRKATVMCIWFYFRKLWGFYRVYSSSNAAQDGACKCWIAAWKRIFFSCNTQINMDVSDRTYLVAFGQFFQMLDRLSFVLQCQIQIPLWWLFCLNLWFYLIKSRLLFSRFPIQLTSFVTNLGRN